MTRSRQQSPRPIRTARCSTRSAKAFMGAFTKNVPGVPGISRTFATEVMCHPVLLGLADRILGPSCARFQLNLGQILERGPGSEDQWLHRDEGVWVDVPKPSPELAARVGDRAGGLHPGEWRDPSGARQPHVAGPLPVDGPADDSPRPTRSVVAEMPAGSAVIYTGGVIHGGGANVTDQPRRAVHLSYCLGWLRTEENNYLSIPPPIAAALPRQVQEVIGYSVYDAHRSRWRLSRDGANAGSGRVAGPRRALRRVRTCRR